MAIYSSNVDVNEFFLDLSHDLRLPYPTFAPKLDNSTL